MSVRVRKRRLSSGRTRLYLAVNAFGQRKYETLQLYLTKNGSHNKDALRLAEAIRAKRELDIQANAEGLPAPWRRDVDLFDYAENLCKSKTRAEQSTINNSLACLRSYAGEHITFARISERFCSEFQIYLLSRLKRNSAAAYFARFKSILRSAQKEGYLQRNPAADLSIRTVETLPKYLTYEELLQLISVPCGNPIVRDAFLFSVNTGLRYVDVRKLVWSQIENHAMTFTQSKTDAPDIVPLNNSAAAILNRQLENQGNKVGPGDQIFLLPRRSTVDKVLRTWSRRAGLAKEISYNRARHTFATLMVTNNVDIYTISRLMGHRSVASTQIYAKVIDSKKRMAIEKLPKIEIQ